MVIMSFFLRCYSYAVQKRKLRGWRRNIPSCHKVSNHSCNKTVNVNFVHFHFFKIFFRYDARFGDAFWNSSKYSMLQYLYMMMTSWAIVCDVWYLPPMYRDEDETAIDFANRVKSVIAKQGGLVDLVWDGQLKRMKAKKEWKEVQQEKFAERLKGD